ncbi:hypothetical protein FIBSPDRAFT_1048529 [Athelia psychrophila]|uniref:F-box domain-containing protein n=1 Tax=Athelia psychrophila TaxID=1759441 RepID=A0A166DMJ8_9AGAM|nr:hypothetical protein FIBSPDRAFT_1048529 [Fibularhizoctonia sp. CBS 109695]
MQFELGLNVQPVDVLLQRSVLNNSEAATANTPDEILALIFEACMQLDHDDRKEHYGDLVSHISHRWRSVALATAGLWTQIRYCDYPVTTLMERVTAYFHRSKLAPVDIRVEMSHRDHHLPPTLFQHLIDHIGHCRRLCFVNMTGDTLESLLRQIALQPEASLLRSFQISKYRGYLSNMPSLPGSTIEFLAPHLRIMVLDEIAVNDVHHFFDISANFKSVTHLRLDDIFIDEMEFERYAACRSFLMALPSLTHLELKVDGMVDFPDEHATVLPYLQFLHIEFSYFFSAVKNIIHTIHARSLQTLSLAGWEKDTRSFTQSSLPVSHFPSLRHLILDGYLATTLLDLQSLGLMFPSTERLTFQAQRSPPSGDIDTILLAIVNPLSRISSATGESVLWYKLQSIAVSTAQAPLDGEFLHELIHDWKKSGHPLDKLFIPRSCMAQAGAKGMMKLRKLVDIEDFRAEPAILIKDMY